MAPLLIPIVGMLAEKGLSLLSKAIDSGSDKAIEFIEEKTGLTLTEPEIKKMSNEDIAKLKQVQIDYEIELLRLALADKVEDNRHEEALTGGIIGDKQNARGASHLNEAQIGIANKIYSQSMFMIPSLLIMNAGLVVYADKLDMDTTAVVAVGNLIGMALNNAYRERQSIIEFLFGSSIGSKIKDK